MTDDTELLRRAASRLDPDIDLLVAGGTARGRRLRRRRRLGAGVGAAAVAGVVAASAVLVPQLLDDDTKVADGSGFAEDSPTAADTTPIPSEDIKPDEADQPSPPEAPTLSIRAKDLPGLVTSLFPGTVSDAPEDTGQIMSAGQSFQIAHFLWNGTMMSVGASSAGRGDPLKRCQSNLGDGATCVARPDGSALLTSQQTGPAVDGGVSSRFVGLYVVGWDLFAMSYNAGDGKDAPLVADEPPFTHEQLTTIVDDPSWFG